jgi:hypothetical protein
MDSEGVYTRRVPRGARSVNAQKSLLAKLAAR